VSRTHKNECKTASETEQQIAKNSATATFKADEVCKVHKLQSHSLTHSFIHSLTHSLMHSFVHSFLCTLIHACMHACTKNVSAPGAWHTQRQGQEVSHFDLLEGLFRLIQILQRDAHLVVQLGQPPVIRLHHIRPRQVAIMSYGCT